MKIWCSSLFTTLSLIMQVKTNDDDRQTKSLARRQVIRQYPPGTALLANGKRVCGGNDETLYEFVYLPVDQTPHDEGDSKSKTKKPHFKYRVYRGHRNSFVFDVEILNSLIIKNIDTCKRPSNILVENRPTDRPRGRELDCNEKRPKYSTSTDKKKFTDPSVKNETDAHSSSNVPDLLPHKPKCEPIKSNENLKEEKHDDVLLNQKKNTSDQNIKHEINARHSSSDVPKPKYELFGSTENLKEEKHGNVLLSMTKKRDRP